MKFAKLNTVIITDIKAPTPIDAIPQENITGDVMRGYGPRRGNLERLLRYWRPIMRKPGGFRRCRVILADHPELYPLNNICAWLHHETTGLWPNEGCHHPGMKNCRKKLKNVTKGSIWSDSQFDDRLAKIRASAKKNDPAFEVGGYVVTEDDVKHANLVLRDFVTMEPQFVRYIADESNWTHEGMDDDDNWQEHDWVKPTDGCGCGCGHEKPSMTGLRLMIGH